MKKFLLFLLLLLLVSSVYSQNSWRIPKSLMDVVGTDPIQFKPGKYLDNGQTIWLSGQARTPDRSYSFRSTDGGKTWSKTLLSIAKRTAGIDAFSKDTAFMALADGSIVRTVNGGTTWTVVHNYTEGAFFDGLRILDNRTIVAFGDGDATGFFYACKSTDGGATWAKITMPTLDMNSAGFGYFTYGTCIDALGLNAWMAVYGSSADRPYIVKTTDGGGTWKATKLNNVYFRFRGISFLSATNGMGVDDSLNVYKTTDGGDNWTKVSVPAPNRGLLQIKGVYGIRGTNTMIVLGHVEGTGINKMPIIWSTTDMGTTWVRDLVSIPNFVPGSTNAYNSGATMFDLSKGFAFGADGVIYEVGIPTVSKNLLLAPEVRLDGKIAKGLIFIPGKILDNGNTIWFCGWRLDNSGNATETVPFLSTDGGSTFTQGASVPGGAANLDAYNKTTALMATDQGNIHRTTDGGKTWTIVHSYSLAGSFQWFDGIKVIDDSIVIAYGDMANSGEGLYVCRSGDQGKTFTKLTGLPNLGSAYNGIYSYGGAMCSFGSTVWITATDYVAGNGRILISSDAGLTWKVTTIPSPSKYAFTISFGNAKNGFIADDAGNLLVSSDGGNTFAKLITPPASATTNAALAVPNTNMFVTMGSKGSGSSLNYAAYYTTDLGATWTEILSPPAGVGEKLIGGNLLNENMGYIYSSKGYILKLGIGTPSAIEPPFVNIPSRFSLEQNYPNPFNPSTMIRFNLTQSENVKLIVYDVIGRVVKTLVNDKLSAGSHEYRFDASNLTSGIYYYSLTTGSNIETKKMVLMK